MNNRTKVCGVGINDANYVIRVNEDIGKGSNGKRKQRTIWVCPFYRAWADMLKRVYANRYTDRYPSYKDVIVCEEWHTFSNFKAWMERQSWNGMYLDKDILTNKKIYSPETCAFVPEKINNLLLDRKQQRGNYSLGVSYDKDRDKYFSQINGGFGNHINLGRFSTEEAAHKAWQLEKAKVIEASINWWQFTSEVNHSFRQDVADVLFDKANKLREYADKGLKTVKV